MFRKARLTRRGATLPAAQVPVGIHKTYERMQFVQLPAPAASSTSLSEVLEKRSSYEKGSMAGSFSPEIWGTLLGLALGKDPNSHHRHYPSGGALYPIESYVITRLDNAHTFSVCHYNPSKHSLEILWELPLAYDIKQLVRKPENLLFSSLIIFTAVWQRSSAKYGDFTYTPALLEAGHMSENILLTATALNIKARPMAGFDDDKLIEILDIDPMYEQPVHTVVF